VVSDSQESPGTSDTTRQEAVREFKRQLIRDAAKRIFAEKGIAGASVREIAKAAGYTTGAIYTYFTTREDLYADVLRDSLGALHDEVAAAAAAATSERAAAALRGLWTFYDSHPADFDLGFYLYGGARPVGLTPELNRELNTLLDRVVLLIAEHMVAEGLAAPQDAHHLAVTYATSVFGLLLMTKTGRLRSLNEDAPGVLDTYLTTLNQGATGPAERNQESSS
jgi:AcrR family transcriptional regulator